MRKLISYVSMFYLLALMFFIWGAATYKFNIFPFWQIRSITTQLEDFWRLNHHDVALDVLKLDHQEMRTQFDFKGLKIVDDNFTDDGYLLISRYSKLHSQTIVELFDIAGNQVVHTWTPNLELIFAVTTDFIIGFNTRMAYRSQHPLLMPNGDLVFGSGEGALVKVDACGGLKWAINRHFHHSIELDAVGNIVAPVVAVWHDDYPGDLYVRDDSVAVISPKGKIISEYSVHKAFLDNGYQGLVFGVGSFEDDRYHLNDVQPIEGRVASEGLLLSLRNISTVALFVPRTGKFEWLKTGPWLNQHDINDMGGGRYSIFGNNLVRGGKGIMGGHSEIYQFTPSTGQIETPYSRVLAQVNMATSSGGRLRILDNGDAFIEQTDGERLMRISRDQVRWEYTNVISENAKGEKTTGSLNWSRYLPRDRFDVHWLETLSCE